MVKEDKLDPLLIRSRSTIRYLRDGLSRLEATTALAVDSEVYRQTANKLASRVGSALDIPALDHSKLHSGWDVPATHLKELSR